MRTADLIAIKRDGGEWTSEQIDWFVMGFVHGEVPDYQMAAWLMAVCTRGMTARETADLTLVMAASGDQIDLSSLGTATADKHSSGGVGDKTSLIVGPLAAACGVKVAKMSGRGLAHTGGTIDKLESIQGFKTALSLAEFIAQVEQIGLVIAGQTANLAPADKKMYALRDVTATVPSIPLIASSIMSKKIAAGARNIVLDVKTGEGAFMRTVEEAIVLAQTMVAIGTHLERKVVTLITDMNQPLGQAVGNAIEVAEAWATLQAQGPADLTQLSVELAGEMVRLALHIPDHEARKRVEEALTSGRAAACFRAWTEAQGGVWQADDLVMPQAPCIVPVVAASSGAVLQVSALTIGQVAMELGAGRAHLDDVIDHGVGLQVCKRVGDNVLAGEPLAFIHARNQASADAVMAMAQSAFQLTHTKVAAPPLFYAKVNEWGECSYS